MERKTISASNTKLLSKYGLNEFEVKQARLVSFNQGEFLFRQGETMYFIYIVVSGKAKVSMCLSNGKQLSLAYFLSKGIIGELELITNRYEASTTMQAVTELICIGLPLSHYSEKLKNNITFMNIIAGELAEKLMRCSVNSVITALQPLENRLCAYIVQTENNGVFREPCTEVAGMVGASYRHLLRCFDKLCQDGVLNKEPCGYRVINRILLEEKAGDLYMTM